MKTLHEILKILEIHKQELKERFGVLKIGVFGSIARGEETGKSDIDIYVEIDLEKMSFSKYLELIDYLENLLGRKVDLLTRDSVETIRIPYIKEEIKGSIVYV
ncbi:MAG: nucleotidyltransferase [Archaeoglobus sp.]|jgi:predicted nucleotidyltransferase|nr:MAG: nucleotidyltransferase [Archaeoglobus sp.]